MIEPMPCSCGFERGSESEITLELAWLAGPSSFLVPSDGRARETVFALGNRDTMSQNEFQARATHRISRKRSMPGK